MRVVSAFLVSVLAMFAVCLLLLGWIAFLVIPVVLVTALVAGVPLVLAMEGRGRKSVSEHVLLGSLLSLVSVPISALVGTWWPVPFGLALGALGGYVYWWAAINAPSRYPHA